MANPTTNYGFVLPTSSDLVTDLPADFDVALQGVDTRLKALQPGTTLGDLAYSSATANTNTRLGIGSNGQVLTVAAGVPSWSSPAAGGKLIQVVSATNTTSKNITSSTYTDTNLTATITPTLNTSKIMVLITQQFTLYQSATNASAYGSIQIVRDATAVYTNSIEALVSNPVSAGQTAINYSGIVSAHYLDSPATTSATTYKTQANRQTAGYINLQTDSSMSTIILMEIGA